MEAEVQCHSFLVQKEIQTNKYRDRNGKEKVFPVNLLLSHSKFLGYEVSFKTVHPMAKKKKKSVLVNLIVFISCSHDFPGHQSTGCS